MHAIPSGRKIRIKKVEKIKKIFIKSEIKKKFFLDGIKKFFKKNFFSNEIFFCAQGSAVAPQIFFHWKKNQSQNLQEKNQKPIIKKKSQKKKIHIKFIKKKKQISNLPEILFTKSQKKYFFHSNQFKKKNQALKYHTSKQDQGSIALDLANC